MRKMLITGARGQLGTDLTRHFAGSWQVHGVGSQDVDIRDGKAVQELLRKMKPDVALHAAAMTDVDRCEVEPDNAFAVNTDGTKNIAAACRQSNSRLIYFSTDYVFDGKKSDPYTESDPPNPQTHYGLSKLRGEEAVQEALEDYVIIRVSWVYGVTGKNFIKTMIELAQKQKENQTNQDFTPLRVVNDQTGTPTWTKEIARQTADILDNKVTGIIHATAEGATTWYSFACRIFELLDLSVEVRPCTTQEFPRPALRPQYSVLENERLKKMGLNSMRPWDTALTEYLTKTREFSSI